MVSRFGVDDLLGLELACGGCGWLAPDLECEFHRVLSFLVSSGTAVKGGGSRDE
jgi:hypothetical protein